MNVSLARLTELLVESDLAQADQLDAMIERLGPTDKPVDAARLVAELLETGVLTDLQSEWLLGGRSLSMGHYVLCEKIGEGGMGAVYAVRHRHMRRMAALKLIRPDRFKVGAIERFKREIQLTGRLRHTNLVTAYDAGEVQGSLYLVMELVEGIDLARRVRKCGAMSLGAALDAVRQTATGLDYLHSLKLVHRDIKPSNLLLDRQGIVKILDLGLSRMVEWSEAMQAGACCDLTGSDEVMGSVDFMSPEQFVNPRSVDARADVYSLGCTLYCLVSGKPPFPGASVGERIVAHREHAVPSLRDLIPDIPARLDRLFGRMLAKDPGQRPGDMQSVIAEIDASGMAAACKNEPTMAAGEAPTLAQREPITATLSNVSGRGRRGTKMAAWSGAIVLLVFASVFAVHLWLARVEPAAGDMPTSRSTASAGIQTKRNLERPPSTVPVATTFSATEGESPRVTASQPNENTASPLGANETEREVALWAIGLGGEVQLQSATGFDTARSADDLPRQVFHIQRLNLAGLPLAQADFGALARLSQLTVLDLGRSDADDRVLHAVGRIASLTDLSLMGTRIGDDGLKELDELAGLKRLDLRGTRVTDEGVMRLPAHHAIESLWLGEGQMLSDQGAERLADMISLTSLGLRHTRVTDKSIFALQALERLEWLDLGGCTSLSDECLVALRRFKSLKHTLMDGVPVSASRIAELEANRVRVDR